MSRGFRRIPQPIVRSFTVLLAIFLLLGGDLTMSRATGYQSLLKAQAALADDGCGPGMTVEKNLGSDPIDPRAVRVKVAANTCAAAARVTSIRELANKLTPAGTIFERFGILATLMPILGGRKGPTATIGIGGGIGGFTMSGSVGVWQSKLISLANKLQQANQACGSRGIYYEMVVIGKAVVRLEKFACQGKNGQPPDLPKDKSAEEEFDIELLDIEPLTGIDNEEWLIVPSPQDDGGDACSTNTNSPYYHQDSDNYYQDVFQTSGSDGNTYDVTAWNPETGLYEINVGAVTRCAPQSTPEPTPDPTPGPDEPYTPHPEMGDECSSTYYTYKNRQQFNRPDGTIVYADTNYYGVFVYSEYDGLSGGGYDLWFFRYDIYKFNPINGEYEFFQPAADHYRGGLPCRSAAP